MRMLDLSVLSSLLVVAACGGDDGGGGVVIVDGPAPVNCQVEPSVTAGSQSQTFYQNNMMGQTGLYAAIVALNQDAMPDLLAVELYAGAGPFMSGFPPTGATLQLSGESDYATCAGCVLIYADSTDQAFGEPYMANSGTLTLTSITTTSLAGTLSNVGLRHVAIADNLATTDHPDGCTSSLASASFSGTPMMVSARTLPDGTTQQGMRYSLKFDRPAK